ncbi:MAG: porin, partial [Burkholderiaceae bacterium]|nr:porin [Burkholderiaceae bacterium]
FGNPTRHTGFFAQIHNDSVLDFYLGVDAGVNTSITRGDNNNSAALLAGFGLNNLLDGKLTLLALTHIGAENPNVQSQPRLDKFLRYINDVFLTYKVSNKLSTVVEAQYIHDEYGVAGINERRIPADAFGVAGYLSYQLNERVTFNTRTEFFRDKQGFYVGAFPGNLDVANTLKGDKNTSYGSPGNYFEQTIGITFKPWFEKQVSYSGVTFRTELRYDLDTNSHRQFSLGNKSVVGTGKNHQLTAAIDLMMPF